MPKTFIRKSSTWAEIKSIFVKKSTGWAEVKNVFIKKASGWVKVFTKANLPDTTTAPSIRTTNTGTGGLYDGPVASSPQFLDADLFGKDGVYTNYTSIFGRKFSRGISAGTTSRTTIVSNEDRFTSAGGVTTAMREACDDQFLFYELTVQNGSAANEIYPISSAIKMIKKQPALGAFTTAVTGNPTPGSVLTFNYNLENYYYNRVEQANSKIRWWRSSTTSPGGVMVKEEILTGTVTSSNESSLSGTSTYTVATSADNDSYIVVEIVVGSSWTRQFGHNNEYRLNSYSAGQVKTAYRFSFGNTLYVSSNGHIGLDNGTSSSTTMSDGRNIAIFPKDLVQYYLAEYSDNSVYLLYFKSYLYNTSASSVNALDYQIKFYNNPAINYCDVYIVRKGSSVTFSDFAPGYYSSGTTGFAGILGPYVISAGSRIRIYFGDQAATTSGPAWTLIDDALWDVIQTWTYPTGADDIFTPVVSAANQSAPVPTTPTALSSSISASNEIVLTFSGGTGSQYDVFYANQDSRPTDQQATTDYPNVTSPFTVTALTAFRGITRWFWVRKSTGTLRSNWFPAGSGVTARIPLFAPPAPVITNSAQTENSLSWYWTKPTPTASEDEPTSWDYALTQSTSTPTSWTNITTIPTSASPLVISTLNAGTDYYLHVKAKNADNSTLAVPVKGTTLAALSSPTISSVSYNTSNSTWTVNYTGGSGPFYQIWYQPVQSTAQPSLNGTISSTADASSSSSSSTSKVVGATETYVYWWWVRSAKTLNATGAGNVSDWNGPVTASPINTATPTLTGTTKVGQTLTYGRGTWLNASSTTTQLYRGTQFVNMSETPVESTTLSSKTYTIPSSDFTDPNNRKYYRSFSRGENASFNAAYVAGAELGPLTNIVLYTITFDSLSGTAVSSLTQATESGSIAKPTDPTKTDVIFGGWSTTNGGTTAVTWPRTPTANETLYAIWTSTYSLSYNSNGGTGTMTPTTGTGNVTVKTNTFTRTNCDFAGWNTAADGTGTAYANGATFNLTANATLYARWTAKSNSATAPTGFKFDGNNLPTAGRKRWSWTGPGTVTNGTATGIRVQMSSTNATSGFTTQTTLATTARTWDVAVSPVTSFRWVRVAMVYTDGLGVTQVGTNSAAF